MAPDYIDKPTFIDAHGTEIKPTCGDCGVLPGQQHTGRDLDVECDTMICPVSDCRQQRLIGCDHVFTSGEWTYSYARDLFRLTPQAEAKRVQALNVRLGRV